MYNTKSCDVWDECQKHIPNNVILEHISQDYQI